MPYEYFSELFFGDLFFNIILVAATMLVVFFIYRRHIYSIFDPLLYFLFFSSAGYSVVFILYFSGLISQYYLVHFLITQFSLIAGFLLFSPLKLDRAVSVGQPMAFSMTLRVRTLYIVSSFLYLVSHAFLYSIKGIPLFMASRLDATTGGFGIVLSIMMVSSVVVIIVLAYKFLIGVKFSVLDWAMVLFYIVFSILNGSKSVFIDSAFVIFYVAYFLTFKMKDYIFIKKFNGISYKIIFLAAVALFLILLIKGENPINHVIFRIIMTGDIYMMSYVDNNIQFLEGSFLSLTLPYKLVNLFNLEFFPVIGKQLLSIVYGVDINAGPNARHNIFGFVSFGYIGSVVFSFFIGLVMGFLRNRLIKLMKSNVESLIIFVLVVNNAFSLESDFNFAFFKFISLGFALVIIYALSFPFFAKSTAAKT